ncbi:MAG: transposase [Tepidisphaera sp.]|nr:transposase [Tepidisphaera sp.]
MQDGVAPFLRPFPRESAGLGRFGGGAGGMKPGKAGTFLARDCDDTVSPVSLARRAPNLNAHVERFIQTLRDECPDGFIVMGAGHMDHLTAEFIDHYNRERPHSSLEFATPAGRRPSTCAGPP